jgi:dipeptidyl aminopeptidase/acylaminoacyl peptidase
MRCLPLLLSAISVFAADATLPVPPNLKPDGMPPIALSLYNDLAQYTDYRTTVLLDWHPSKREMLISTRFGDVPQIHRVSMPGGARTQLTFYPERVTSARYRPRTADVFVFSKDVGGGEWFQLYRFDVATGKITLLTDGGKSRNIGPVWSRDGRQLAYGSTRRNNKDVDIWVMDPDKPESARMTLQTDSGGWQVADWSPDGTKLLVEKFESAVRSSLYLADAATGAKTRLTPETDASYHTAQFSADGRGVYLLTNENSDLERLAYMDLGTRKIEILRPDLRWDVDHLRITLDGKRLAYLTNEDGWGVLHIMDTGTRRDLKLPALPHGNVENFDWRENGRELGVTVTSSSIPADVFSVDLDDGKVERWTTSETGGLDGSSFAQPELVHWKSFDGLTISGLYFKPPARFAGKRPVIVSIHGGPEGQSRPGYIAAFNYLVNELGVALIEPNVRGSTGYGKKFLNLDNEYKREDSVKDIGALLDWIASQPGLDAQRVMVTGGSYGGYMTLASMVHFNDRLRCAVEAVGISNWVTFLEHTEAYRRDLRRVEYGDERDPKMRDFLLTISPANHADKITKPMFIIAGRNDPRVPWTEGQQMTEAIRKNGVPIWFLVAEDEGHGFSKKKNRDYQFAAMVQFVRQYLLD